MSLVLALLLSLVLSACVRVQTVSGVKTAPIVVPRGDWVTCDQPDAQYEIVLEYSIDGLFEKHPWGEWIRERPKPIRHVTKVLPDGSEVVEMESFTESGGIFVDGVMPDGHGCGYNADIRLSPALEPPTQAFDLYVRIQWDYGSDRGSYEHTFFLPELKDTLVRHRRLSVNMVVKKLAPQESSGQTGR